MALDVEDGTGIISAWISGLGQSLLYLGSDEVGARAPEFLHVKAWKKTAEPEVPILALYE